MDPGRLSAASGGRWMRFIISALAAGSRMPLTTIAVQAGEAGHFCGSTGNHRGKVLQLAYTHTVLALTSSICLSCLTYSFTSPGVRLVDSKLILVPYLKDGLIPPSTPIDVAQHKHQLLNYVTMSHCGIGTGVTILRHNDYYDYVLVELFSHQDTRTHLASNKVTLFLWWSPSSSPLADEVLLPIPASNQDKDDVTWPPTYSFRADMVFAVSTTSLCWVDLRTGILVCDHIDKLGTGTDDDDDHLLLLFISLPEDCVMKPSLLSWKRSAEEHRTMICRDPETILFISMDNYIQGLPIGDTVLTTWTLKFPLTNHWTWEKHSAPSLFVGDLLNDLPVLKLKNPRMIGRRCTLPTARLTITEYERKYEQGHWGVTGFRTRSALTWMVERSWSGLLLKVATQIFAAEFNCCLQQTMGWESLQRSRSSTFKSLSDEEVVDEDDENWKWVFPMKWGYFSHLSKFIEY
uniref:DUF1618 domain-containing protein n=1 Tax=Oryza meridionalis TaxID=40149 RepID=A0A0E0DB72_9ORYZ